MQRLNPIKLPTIIVIVTFILFATCKKDNESTEIDVDFKPEKLEVDYGGGTVEDIDGNVYKTVFIGEQEWMAENLKTTRYRDGSDIDYPEDFTSWANNTSGAYGWYKDDESNKELFGAVYNWYAVANESQLCPPGWSVPDDGDWSALLNYLTKKYSLSNHRDNTGGVGNRLKSCLQVNSPLGSTCATADHPRWNKHDDHYGFDDFNFSALPIGSRSGVNDYISNPGAYVHWWSFTSDGAEKAFYRYITFDNGALFSYSSNKNNGYAVRCVR